MFFQKERDPMKKLFSISLLTGALLLFAGNAMALTVSIGDSVKMTAPSDGENYLMYDINDNVYYNAFCVERNEYFSSGGIYTVESIGDVAYGGGISGQDASIGGDPISDVTKWLYASYFEGTLGVRSGSLANEVQNAIWYAEGEITNDHWFDKFTSGVSDFSVSGWDIQVVNLTYQGQPRQSQLIGAPVPEPATMLLFGTGLAGLAGSRLRRKKK